MWFLRFWPNIVTITLTLMLILLLISTTKVSSYSSTTVQSSKYSSSELVSGGDTTNIFLRFSPLIGGPPFLPLHVEVILGMASNNSYAEFMDKKIYVRRTNNLSFLKEHATQLHRFDFLPMNPTDPSTISRLLTLRSVPAKVRHRIVQSSNNVDVQKDDDRSTSVQDDGKGITLLVPIRSVVADDIIPRALDFKEQYKDTLFRELRLIGGKNCLTFALDLISHVEA